MKVDAKKLLEEALKLPPEARAALAGSLLESLDDSVDPGAEAAWAAEIARRITELDSGKVKAVPWSEAIEQIAQFSDRWPQYIHGTRRYLLWRFPFSIVYRDRGEVIQVLAVAHGRRRPGYWEDRA